MNQLNEALKNVLNFETLVQRIETTERVLQNNARLVINRHTTAKAWLTGYYIVEYEQKGNDRAKYGEKLLQKLSQKLGVKRFSVTSLKIYRQFYIVYPHLGSQITKFIEENSFNVNLSEFQLEITDNQLIRIGQSVTDQFKRSGFENIVDISKIFNKLSFTHLVSLLTIADPLERAFYETMAIKYTWSSRELERQIDSKYYIRSGWSKEPDKLIELINNKIEHSTINSEIKSPFVFEFLGLKAKDVLEETDIETALINHLQDFILELGMGFCFEDRQKKLLIDDRYYKVDLVFYHRILKRHIIIELKAHRLNYSDVAQLNMYLAYFRKNIMLSDDNEPIGILLCSEVGQEMAEYTMMSADANLFLSRYELELPSKEQMTEFLRKENESLQ